MKRVNEQVGVDSYFTVWCRCAVRTEDGKSGWQFSITTNKGAVNLIETDPVFATEDIAKQVGRQMMNALYYVATQYRIYPPISQTELMEGEGHD